MSHILKQLEKQLVVSCQALKDEPLHSPMIMGKMAIAAKQGEAAGIRANSSEDINEIKKNVSLPVIGIWKQDYRDSEVFITPTMREVSSLIKTEAEIIAMDATSRLRPNGEKLKDIVAITKKEAPEVLLMADVSTLKEAKHAEQLGFDLISTTLVGYTSETEGQNIKDNDFKLLRNMVDCLSIPVVAEGKVSSPELAVEALRNGAHFVVVGSAITRPQLITKNFTQYMKK